MKNFQILSSVMSFIIISFTITAQDYHVRIGTIGNSITHGNSLTNPEQDAYPIQLGNMLEQVYGDTCIVKNFGLTTTTMLKNGDTPYWATEHFKNYLSWAPEICLILLGTNDTKPKNWDAYGDEFIGDYLAMIDTIKQRNPSTLFLLGYPPPAFEVVYEIRDSVIINGVIPAIDSIVKLVDVEIVDFYNTMLDSRDLFTDDIHPNVEGNTLMAEILLDKIIETDIIHEADTGLTFIIEFKTESSALIKDESTELSWTTINANSVFLNGESVDINGSTTITPSDTTIYTLIAEGERSIDTVYLTQIVYVPELSRLRINPSKATRYEGDTIFFEISYYDQVNKKITDKTYSVNWEIIEGDGILFDETNTSASFVTVGNDTTYLQVSYGDVSITATIIIIPSTTEIKSDALLDGTKIFPNPCNETLNIQVSNANSIHTLSIYDLKGVMLYSEEFNSDNLEQQIYKIKTTNLLKGTYILKVEYSDLIRSEKFYKFCK